MSTAASSAMNQAIALQVEVTTRCNFDCFYCAGRAMRQGDMAYATFESILNSHIQKHGIPSVVSLQGEGEPTLHHDFFRMAARVRDVGSHPYTITNGTHKHPDYFVGLFKSVGVSVDTLDEEAARKIGRYNLPRVIQFVESLAKHLTIVIHSVASRRETPRIAEWCKQRGYRHVVQPLQSKADYSTRYPKLIKQTISTERFNCSYLAQPRMRYFTLDAIEMPCAFIKDASKYEGIDSLLVHQKEGTWSASCAGCRYGRDAVKKVPAELRKASELKAESRWQLQSTIVEIRD